MYYLYRHIRLDKNEVFYIGISKVNTKYNTFKCNYQRAYTKKSRNQYWKNIVNKTKYNVEIMLHFKTEQEACDKEIELIKLYYKSLCNITSGGLGTNTYKHTEETKKRISKKLKLRVQSKETLRKINQSKLKGVRMFNEKESYNFESRTQAAEFLGNKNLRANISRYLKFGKSKVKGYMFEEIIETKDKEPL